MRTLGSAVLLGLAIGAGCQPPEPTLPEPAAAIPVDVIPARFEAIDAALTGHKGKVVLVDFWATWCGPCVQSFPHFVKHHKTRADKGLVCISVSLDPRGKDDKYDQSEVLKFLKAKGATFPNFVLLGYRDDDEKVAKRFGLGGSIPFQALFGKDGKRVWTSEDKELSDAEVGTLIEIELAK